jgi:pentatricopeptide repeat protein
MRLPYTCRPCLARLRLYSLQNTRCLAALHTAVALDPAVEFSRRYDDGDSSTANPDQTESSHQPVHDKDQLFRGTQELVRISPSVLRTRLLEKSHDHKTTQTYIGGVFGLSAPAASKSVSQLQRLLPAQPHEEAEALYAKYQAWKLEFSSRLRKSAFNNSDTAGSRLANWAVLADGTNPSVAAMKASWAALDTEKRQDSWPKMIQSLVDTNSDLLSTFLQATYDPAWSPFYVVEDSLRLLVMRPKLAAETHHDGLVDLVLFLMKTDTAGVIEVDQQLIGAVVSRTNEVDKVEELYHYMVSSDKNLSAPTLLQFASKFSKSTRHKALATDILCSMTKSNNLNINSAAGSSVCTSLLHLEKDSEIPQEAAAPDEIFRSLLEAGLDPNLLNITALMRNFCVRGHLDTAWTVFNLLLEYGIEPDQHVYATLLHGAKQDLNTDLIRRIMASIHSHNVWNVTMLNDFLDILLRDGESISETRRRQKKDMSPFRSMLLVYAKFFHLEPLQKICSFPLEDYLVWEGPAPGKSTPIRDIALTLLPLPEGSLLEPDSLTLSFMLAAALRGCPRFYPPKLRNGVASLQEQMNHFNRLVEQKDSTALGIIERQGTWIYDAFLRAILQFQQCLHPAVQLVQTMMERSAAERTRYGQNRRHPRPSVHTWTVLINGFKNHRQPGIAASMVRVMLKQGGVRPNIVTWNTLIKAFARSNDAEGAVRTIRYLECSGLTPDKDTIDAIGSMSSRARKQALRLMEAPNDELVSPDDDIVQLLADPRSSGHIDTTYSDPIIKDALSVSKPGSKQP